MKLYWSDPLVWLASEALDYPGRDRSERSEPDAIRHARAMAKKVRKPARLNDPNEWSLKNPARNRDGQVRPGSEGGRLKVLETGHPVVYALDPLTVGEGRHQLLPIRTRRGEWNTLQVQ